MDEVPDNIEDAFTHLNLHLLPYSRQDFQTICSCPDWKNPCKHIAGVYYLVASELDRDPFLLFELRGIDRAKLQQELAKSPLGKALSSALEAEEIPIEPVDSYYTQPKKVPLTASGSSKDFWLGGKRLPQTVEAPSKASIPAILVKKGGDFPSFWHENHSFLEVMEELYQRVKIKNQF